MKRYTAAEARARFADVLDHAEGGEPVVIERNGVRFQVTRAPARRRTTVTEPLIDILDPAVERGEWTWTHASSGTWRYTPRRAKRRSSR
jgi:antitoxin (DNA-binding transcriptional repressor) of toxin-antitoxin stability system